MRTKKRKVLNGQAQGNYWSACQYKIRKVSGWVAIERDHDSMKFSVCVKDQEANVRLMNDQLPFETHLEAERLFNFAISTRDKAGRARVTVVSKLLRHLRKARYGEATMFGVLLKRLFEKAHLEDVG